MTQENEVTPSTTNTAARELLASALDECGRPTDAAEVREGRNPFVRGEYALVAIEAVLTQQQGGEQEAGDGLPELPMQWKSEAPGTCLYTADQMRAYATAALRTKQPAASEWDGRVPEAELLALVAGPYMYHHKMNELQEREAKGFDRCRELTMENIRIWCATRRAMFAANTSKQAAGEAVAWQIMRAAFVTADENYSGKRVAAVYADASMIGQRVRLIFDTTPPRHPADEGVSSKYEELIYAVGNKYPGESRHETALRYIRQAETPSNAAAQSDKAGTP